VEICTGCGKGMWISVHLNPPLNLLGFPHPVSNVVFGLKLLTGKLSLVVNSSRIYLTFWAFINYYFKSLQFSYRNLLVCTFIQIKMYFGAKEYHFQGYRNAPNILAEFTIYTAFWV
jgi:hypothetical protein